MRLPACAGAQFQPGYWNAALVAAIAHVITLPNTLPILVAVAAATLVGDYFIKTAALSPSGIHNPRLAIGAIIYGLTAVGWFFLMRSHSLAMVAVIFTAMTTVVLAGMGYFPVR